MIDTWQDHLPEQGHWWYTTLMQSESPSVLTTHFFVDNSIFDFPPPPYFHCAWFTLHRTRESARLMARVPATRKGPVALSTPKTWPKIPWSAVRDYHCQISGTQKAPREAPFIDSESRTHTHHILPWKQSPSRWAVACGSLPWGHLRGSPLLIPPESCGGKLLAKG